MELCDGGLALLAGDLADRWQGFASVDSEAAGQEVRAILALMTADFDKGQLMDGDQTKPVGNRGFLPPKLLFCYIS